MDDIAVLIPCYNEEKTIEKVVADAREYMPNAVVYVYDNNSTDRTAELAKCAGAVVRYETMQGKGNVIRRMFREIDARCYIMVDGDDTYPMESAAVMAEKVLNEKVDMVVGDRLSSTYFVENKRRFHNFGNRIVRSSINRLFNCDIRDIMTGFRALSFDFVKTFPVLSGGFEIETEMTIHAVNNHMKIENVIIDYRDRPDGSVSKLNTVSDGLKVLKTIMHLFLEYKPMTFLGITAMVLFLLSVAFMIPVLAAFWETGEVKRFPTLIVCGFAMIAALQAFFSGVILNNIAIANRKQFEMQIISLQTLKNQTRQI